MMKSKYLWYIVIVFLIVVSALTIMRPYVAGVDTYYFINNICKGYDISAPIVSEAIFSVLPCDMTLLQIFQILLMLLGIIPLYLIGKFIANKLEMDWKYYLFFIFTSFYYIFEFLGSLEDDQIALPILLFATYYLIRYIYDNDYRHIIYSCLLILLGLAIWKGAILYVFIVMIILSFKNKYIIIPLILASAIKYEAIIGLFMPNGVMENSAILGIVYLGISIAGLYIMKKDVPLSLKSIIGILFMVVAFNSKYGLHLVPLLAIGLMYLWKDITEDKNYKKYLVIMISLLVMFITIFAIPNLEPTTELVNGISEAYEISLDYNTRLTNDWGLGYHIDYFTDYNSVYKGHEYPCYNFRKSVAITSYYDFNLGSYDVCDKIREEDKFTIWKCD